MIVIGGGLAGCEGAWQAAECGLSVALYEMRPNFQTGAHATANLAELVCSNSLGSNLIDRASGLLKEELRRLGSLLIRCADETSVPAGNALAVDRNLFAARVTESILCHPRIRLFREEIIDIPNQPTIIASGPLTSLHLSAAIQSITGQENLFFFDAISPIVSSDSIDMQVAFRGSRYYEGEKGTGDYINCPMSQEEYERFINALIIAERVKLHYFENQIEDGVSAGLSPYFEGCLPVEIIAARGKEALTFGSMRPTGLRDPRTGKRPYAVVQLRQDNIAGTNYSMVGFQTNLTLAEQRNVFRLIPGLQAAEFVRFGQMHRNTFINSPLLLRSSLQYQNRNDLFFAGQLTGVEGYVGNIATGWLAGQNAVRVIKGYDPIQLPQTTMLGALCHYITHTEEQYFQPMKANFGLLPPLAGPIKMGRGARKIRVQQYVERAMADLELVIQQLRI